MTVPAPRARRRTSMLGRSLPLLLIVVLLAPVGMLFASTWRQTGDDRRLADSERLGVEYLRALAPITEALVEAQSNAVAGRGVPGEPLTRAVEQAAAVDARIGGQLRTQERWAGLRAKLEALRERSPADPEAAFTAYGEVTDLLLALHRKVRESSGLGRDPGADSFFLQDSVGQELPEAVVAAGRLADLGALAGKRPAAERPRSLMEMTGLRVSALSPANDVVDNLRSAVDNSESTDLGANVLTPLDAYQRSVEALALYSTPSASGVVDQGQLAAAALNSRNAARQLQPVILGELDTLLTERADGLARDRWLAVGAGALAALVLIWLAGLLVAADRRTRRRAAAPDAATPAAPPPGDPWQPPAATDIRPLQPVGAAHEPAVEQWGPFDAAR
ncbi:hypothetical protein ACTFTM_29835 [Micromonospora sp. RB23]